jgi:hypothetical protein
MNAITSAMQTKFAAGDLGDQHRNESWQLM